MRVDIFACFSAQLNGLVPRFRVLIAVLRLDKDVSAKSIELMNGLANTIGKVVEKRNNALRHLPGFNDRTDEIGQFRAAVGGHPDHESLAASLTELEFVHSEIIEKLNQFRALCIRIADESYAAWKKKQP